MPLGEAFHKPGRASDDLNLASVACPSDPGQPGMWFLTEVQYLMKLIVIGMWQYCDRIEESLVWPSSSAAEMPWIIHPSLSRQPATTGVPTLPANRRMVQERIFMSTTQASLVGQRPESKLFPRSELICEDNYSYYAVSTLNTGWLNIIYLIRKILHYLEDILNGNVSETSDSNQLVTEQ